jgi:hypothetical protein
MALSTAERAAASAATGGVVVDVVVLVEGSMAVVTLGSAVDDRSGTEVVSPDGLPDDALVSSEHAPSARTATASTATNLIEVRSRDTGATQRLAAVPLALRPARRSRPTTPPSIPSATETEHGQLRIGTEERLPVTGVSPEPHTR